MINQFDIRKLKAIRDVDIEKFPFTLSFKLDKVKPIQWISFLSQFILIVGSYTLISLNAMVYMLITIGIVKLAVSAFLICVGVAVKRSRNLLNDGIKANQIEYNNGILRAISPVMESKVKSISDLMESCYTNLTTNEKIEEIYRTLESSGAYLVLVTCLIFSLAGIFGVTYSSAVFIAGTILVYGAFLYALNSIIETAKLIDQDLNQ